jgi:hypothetical protein
MKKLSIGQKAIVTFANYPNREFQGVIRRLPYPYGGGGSPQDGDKSTRISVDDANVPVERGALAAVRVILQQKDNVLWLPAAAVRRFQGRDFVVVQDGDAQRRIALTTGVSTEERIEIVDGVAEGQIVIGP